MPSSSSNINDHRNDENHLENKKNKFSIYININGDRLLYRSRKKAVGEILGVPVTSFRL